MIIINKNRPIRFKIKGLIIIILTEPRNDYNHTSGPITDRAPLMDMAKELTDRDALCYRQNIWRIDDSAMAHG